MDTSFGGQKLSSLTYSPTSRISLSQKQKDPTPFHKGVGQERKTQRAKEQSAGDTRFKEPSTKALAGRGTRTRCHDTNCGQESRSTHRANDRHHRDSP